MYAAHATLLPTMTTLAALLALPPSAQAQAQDQSQSHADDVAIPPPADRLTAELQAGVWIPRMNGNVRLGGAALDREINLKNGLDLVDLEPVPQAEITIRRDDYWRLRADGFAFSTESDGDVFDRTPATFGSLLLAPGTPFDSSLDLTSVGVEIGADVFHPIKASEQSGTDLRFAPLLGVRWINLEHDLSTPAGRESVEAEWGALYVGFEMRMRYEPQSGAWLPVPLDLHVTLGGGPMIGGGEGGLLGVIRAGVRAEVTDNVSVMAGFRLFEMDAEHEDYEITGGLEGLFLSASLSF